MIGKEHGSHNMLVFKKYPLNFIHDLELPGMKELHVCRNGDVKLDKDGTPMIFWDSVWSPICAHSFGDNRYGADKFCQKLGYTTGILMKIERNFTVDKFMIGLCLKDDVWPFCTGRDNVRKIGSKWKDCTGNLACGHSNTNGIKVQCSGESNFVKLQSCRGMFQTV